MTRVSDESAAMPRSMSTIVDGEAEELQVGGAGTQRYDALPLYSLSGFESAIDVICITTYAFIFLVEEIVPALATSRHTLSSASPRLIVFHR
jgi:hypothetical protein